MTWFTNPLPGISTQPQQCSSAARVYLEGGHFDEMAEVLVGEGRMADAVCALIAAPRDPDRTRRAVEYLLTGLWQHQSFGVDNPETDSEAVSELLALAGVLRKDMREPEAQEVPSLFSHDTALTLENRRSQCSEQDTMPILEHFVTSISSLSEQQITPPLCCALIPSSAPPYRCKAPPRPVLGLRFFSISPTSNFWIT